MSHRYLALLLAAGAFLSLAVSGTTAGPYHRVKAELRAYREVRVTIRNESQNGTWPGKQTFNVEVLDPFGSALSLRLRPRPSRSLAPGEQFVVVSGDFDYSEIIVSAWSCGGEEQGLDFQNPLIGYPSAREVYEASESAGWKERAGQYGPRAIGFTQGQTRFKLNGYARITRHGDSPKYIEFTESLLGRGCG